MAVSYRPSNSTEGEVFFDRWCRRCRRDYVENEEPCSIQTATMFLRVDDPDYPKEWVVGAAGPGCTAYDPVEGADDGAITDVRQGDIFDAR